MERIWLKTYPKYIPAEIEKSAYNSLGEMFEQCCQKHQHYHAMYCLGHHWSYQTLHQKALAFAAYLRHQVGLDTGERIAIMMPNLPQYLIALNGALIAGLTVVNVNPLFTASELKAQLKDAGARHIVILANFAHVLAKAQKENPLDTVIITEAGDMMPVVKRWAINLTVKYIKKQVPKFDITNYVTFNEALSLGQQHRLQRPDIGLEHIAFIQYTGGTTGEPKGVVLTHGNILANVNQIAAWIDGWVVPGEETVITALPLYHIFALSVCGLAFVLLGFCSVLIPDPKDLDRFVKTLRKHPFTIFIGVNTLFKALLRHRQFNQLDFQPLKFAIGGGAAIDPEVADQWQHVTGAPIIEGYGLTEASPVVTINPLDNPQKSSIGLPVPSTDVKFCDDQESELNVEEKGELCVKGPQVMHKYWQKPEDTASVFTADNYLKTGDVGYMDQQGLIYLVDRKKDMIVVSGFNVFPAEVEHVLLKHPDVTEAAVIGVADEGSGEKVKAFVVASNAELTEKNLRDFCRDYLTRYKVPKSIEFREDLPKSNVGKVLRKELK